jgi:hypothetical protein
MGEPQALTHQEIRAWRTNMRLDVRPWEVTALIQVDREWRKAFFEKQAAERPPRPGGKRSREQQRPAEEEAQDEEPTE